MNSTHDAALADFYARIHAMIGSHIFVRVVVDSEAHVWPGTLHFDEQKQRFELVTGIGHVAASFVANDVATVILAGYLELKPVTTNEAWAEIVDA